MSRDESKGNALPVRAEGAGEGSSFEDPATGLADGVVTRAQALKLAGLGGAGFMLTLLWPEEADARRRRKRRRRRKARVTPNPVTVVPGATVLNVTNPSDDKPLTISGVKVLDEEGSLIRTIDLAVDVTIEPGDTGQITITDPLVDAKGLRLIDERGVSITLVDANGDNLGDDIIDVLPPVVLP